MGGRIRARWFGVSSSLWFLPSVMTAAAAALAVLTIRLDRAVLVDPPGAAGWFFGGGSEGARGVLEAIAGTMITVTALVFSITVVALQLASSQLSPRVLRSFMADRGNQIALGLFIGAFTYALLVLRVVRSPLEDAGGFVPSLSVTVAIALALVSVGMLIYFIHHAANAMRASVVIDRAAAATRRLIEDLYPEDVGEPVRGEPPAWLASAAAATVPADDGGYVQAINADALFDLAGRHALTIRPQPMAGAFVLPGEPLAQVWPPAACDAAVAEAVRGAVVLGSERTLQADVGFGFQQIADIAVRALSPGVNDPTTATVCIDRLGELLVRLGQRSKPAEVRSGVNGRVLVVLQGPPFDRLVGVAFDQIRHYGAGDPVVAEHLLAVLGRISDLMPGERRPVARQARLVLAAARGKLDLPDDLERVAAAGAWIDAVNLDGAGAAPTGMARPRS